MNFFGAFPMSPNVVSTMFPNNSWFKKNKNNWPQSLKHPLCISWHPSTLYPTPSTPQHLGAPYCPKKKKIMSNLAPLVFLACLINLAYCHFFIPCQHHVFLLFPTFRRPWCCMGVFLLLIKLRKFLNQNITQYLVVLSQAKMFSYHNIHPMKYQPHNVPPKAKLWLSYNYSCEFPIILHNFQLHWQVHIFFLSHPWTFYNYWFDLSHIG